ncbi:hypothetical protein EEB14_51295 [Rhodococcus sp. WS4]|nr:hypothetical protein EEB14_51295 [Rhodococcus sp. WS4]
MPAACGVGADAASLAAQQDQTEREKADRLEKLGRRISMYSSSIFLRNRIEFLADPNPILLRHGYIHIFFAAR